MRSRHKGDGAAYPVLATPLDDFSAPPARFRGAPFWAWNGALDAPELVRRLDTFKTMGMGGVTIHARSGLTTPYLGDEFMACVRACVERAQALGLQVWLYDEDRWPSGFAGGLVTQDPALRARRLRLTRAPLAKDAGALLARYSVILDNAGSLHAYRRLRGDEQGTPGCAIWSAQLEIASPSPWFNHQGYLDTLNPRAVERFLAVTHERYQRWVGEYFGSVIPGIFSDEPELHQHVEALASPWSEDDLLLPWTDDFDTSFAATYGGSLLDRLPELVWEVTPPLTPVVRYRYYDHLAERFTRAFVDQVGAWCAAHGLLLTGHLNNETPLARQSVTMGEAMRAYRNFGLPGVDILCDWRETNTLKQAQSTVDQDGRPGLLAEIYGVTGWELTFSGHKAIGDWAAALGVTYRVHHHAWETMAGEAKRDYPPSIGPHAPWHSRYGVVEDHFARLAVILRRGVRRARVGVIHPVESFWLCSGPHDQTREAQRALETLFATLPDWLLGHQVDFDYLSEARLPEQCPTPSAPLRVGQCAYDLLVLPGLRTIRSTTLERLIAFQRAGGQIIALGAPPSLVDGLPPMHPLPPMQTLAMEACPQALLDALEPLCDLRVRDGAGMPVPLLHHMRSDGDVRWLFLANSQGEHGLGPVTIQVRGRWQADEWETQTGRVTPQAAHVHKGWTCIVWDAPAHGSLLLQLKPPQRRARAQRIPQLRPLGAIAAPESVYLHEPNALLLDRAAFAIDDGDWQPAEEMLRLDTALRRQWGMRLRMQESAQPWADPPSAVARAVLRLRFDLHLDAAIAAALALEGQWRIIVDGTARDIAPVGFYVDSALAAYPIPALAAGDHTLELITHFSESTPLEWAYLIGAFSVACAGLERRIGSPVHTLRYGDWTEQGLPFYGGAVTYRVGLEGMGAPLTLHAPCFRAALLDVALDGRACGPIAFSPWQCALGLVAPGRHLLEITAYGSRANSFGPIHNATPGSIWMGPDAWRSSGDAWCDLPRLTPLGLLEAPSLLTSSILAHP